MARLSSLITAAVLGIKRCLCAAIVGRGIWNASWNPLGEKATKMESKCGLTPSFSHLGPAESRSGVLAVKTQLALSLLYGYGHSALKKNKMWTLSPGLFAPTLVGGTDWRAGRQACVCRRTMDECMEAENRLHQSTSWCVWHLRVSEDVARGGLVSKGMLGFRVRGTVGSSTFLRIFAHS